MPESKNRITAFDGMRAIAILLIMIHHIELDQRVPWLTDLFRYFGLGIFIFISGYLLERSDHDFTRAGSIRSFARIKFLRLMPLYYVAIILYLVAFPLLQQNLTALSIVAHLLGLQLVFASRTIDPILTLWFVGIVVTYYLFYIAYKRYGQSTVRALMLLVGFTAILLLLRMLGGVSDKKLLLYLGTFCCGLMSGRRDGLSALSRWHFRGALVVLLTSIYIYNIHVYPPTVLVKPQPPLFSGISLAALILANLIMLTTVVVSYGVFKNGVPTPLNRFLTTISYCSYCMYLFHRPYFLGVARVYYPSTELAQQVYLCMVGIPTLVLVSYLVQKGYDRLISSYVRERKIVTA